MRELKEFKIDHTKLQEYFPLNIVINGTFQIYQMLLGLKFEEITNAKTYHDEVRLFQVKDNQTQQVIGHFYTDLHPRDGKYGHAAVFGIQKGCLKGLIIYNRNCI
jgi:Zn-dependent oligopeptidase